MESIDDINGTDTINENIITLHLIINPELENKIISYGEQVEVLYPLSLRKRIIQRLQKAISQY